MEAQDDGAIIAVVIASIAFSRVIQGFANALALERDQAESMREVFVWEH